MYDKKKESSSRTRKRGIAAEERNDAYLTPARRPRSSSAKNSFMTALGVTHVDTAVALNQARRQRTTRTYSSSGRGSSGGSDDSGGSGGASKRTLTISKRRGPQLQLQIKRLAGRRIGPVCASTCEKIGNRLLSCTIPPAFHSVPSRKIGCTGPYAMLNRVTKAIFISDETHTRPGPPQSIILATCAKMIC